MNLHPVGMCVILYNLVKKETDFRCRVCCSKSEGIFRITAENGQEQYVRKQLNRGFVPHGVDVNCLAGLIKVSIIEFIQFFDKVPSLLKS